MKPNRFLFWICSLLFLIALSSGGLAQNLLFDDLDDGDFSGRSMVDEGTISAPSNRYVAGGKIVQSPNIYGPDVPAVENRTGTFLYYDDPAARDWDDYVVQSVFRYTDNDCIGLMFRYQDSDNYHKVDLDVQRNFRKLFKVVKGVETTIANVSGGYEQNTDMNLSVRLVGNQIEVTLDGIDIFGGPVTDASLSSGTVALYCWGNQSCYFDDVSVDIPSPTTILLSDSFSDGNFNGWSVVDQGTISAPSNWSVSGGEVVQSSNIYGPDVPAVENRTGTYLYYDNAGAMEWGDYSLQAKLRSSDDDGIGLMFRYQDENNYYKLDLDLQRGFRKLFKVVSGVETTIANVGGGYTQNADMAVQIDASGNQISVFVDGTDVFNGPITDSDLSGGSVALYCWGSQNCYFDNVVVTTTFLVAAAGLDQTLEDTDTDGFETVVLDASGSYDSDGTIVSYEWREDGNLIATGVNPSVDLNVGTHRLELTVSDNDGNTATDTTVISIESGNLFRIVALPDTQILSQSYPDIFLAQTQWLVDHHQELRIEFVVHEGDIVNNNSDAQWRNADEAMSLLDGIVPYSVVPGNHDMGTNGSANTRDTTLFNQYFPVSRYENTPTFGGVYSVEPDRYDNNYHTFSAGGTDWLVLSLEFGPRDPVLEWANQVVAAHPNHRVIIVSHTYMYYNETRQDTGESWNPHNYGLASEPGGVNDGEEMWEKFTKKRPNITIVLNGHVLGDGLGRLVSEGDYGNLVYQFLTNYQMQTNGGNGFFRILEIDPDQSTLTAKAYSPYLDQYKTDSENQFTYTNVDLGPPSVPTAPQANAGPDQDVADFDSDGYMDVRLDGSTSFDPNGSIVSYEWYEGETFLATGVSPVVTLPLGNHVIKLTVVDNDAETDSDTVSINVTSSLLLDTFSDGDMEGWTIVDEGTISAPSNWFVINDEVVQSSNIYGPNASVTSDRKGTFAVYDNSAAYNWNNYSVDATIRSSDNDGIGIMFYYQDPDNYYKLDLDSQRNFMKLFKVKDGFETTLVAASAAYTINANMAVHIEVGNGQMNVSLDGADLFGPVVDSDLFSGTVAFYCWGNQNAYFDTIEVR